MLRSTDMWRLALIKGLEWHASTEAAGAAAGEGERAVAALEQALLGHLDDSLAAASLLPDSAAATKRAQVPASCRPEKLLIFVIKSFCKAGPKLPLWLMRNKADGLSLVLL